MPSTHMQTLNPREFCNLIPHPRETLEREHELVLVVDGEPVARILPIKTVPRPQSIAAFRASLGRTLPDSTSLIREDRDRRGL